MRRCTCRPRPAPPAPGPAAPVRAALGLLALALALAAGCTPPAPAAFQGYLEADYLHVAAPVPGILTRLAVARGDTVEPAQPLFSLEAGAELASLRESEQRLAQARARHDNLTKGRRPTEIAALEAQLASARARLEWAEADLARRERLRSEEVISPAEWDAARSARDAERAQVASLTAELETARLGARADEIQAAQADVQAAEAAQARARWAVTQKSQAAPAGGRIHDTLYQPGEFVPTGSPVVVLLPPGNLKVRFFVPETLLATVRLGQAVQVSIDGRPQPVPATVSYVATQAEFTPPVIYSRENRAKLVTMVEARLEPKVAAELHVGQPVDVRLEP